MAECPGTFYLAETGDGALARVRIPGGRLADYQLRVISDLATELGNGQIDLTNRGNLQIRGLGTEDGPSLVKALKQAELIAPHMIADRHRNITGSPLSDLDRSALTDVARPIESLDHGLWQVDWLTGLSVKFSFVFDSGGDLSVRGVPHDVGFFAEGNRDVAYFRVSLAGERTPFCVAPGGASRFALCFAQLVAMDEPSGGRMAPLVRRDGVEKLVREACELAEDDVTRRPLPNNCGAIPASPLPGTRSQKHSKKVAVGLGVPMQRLTPRMLEGLASLSAVFGDGTVRLSPWFMIFLADISLDAVEEVRSLLGQLGFLTRPEEGYVRVIACAGGSGCHRAHLDTKADGEALAAGLANLGSCQQTPFTIHLSGCSRGCAYHNRADILLLAEEDGSGYTAYSNARAKDAGDIDDTISGLGPEEIIPFAANKLRPV